MLSNQDAADLQKIHDEDIPARLLALRELAESEDTSAETKDAIELIRKDLIEIGSSLKRVLNNHDADKAKTDRLVADFKEHGVCQIGPGQFLTKATLTQADLDEAQRQEQQRLVAAFTNPKLGIPHARPVKVPYLR